MNKQGVFKKHPSASLHIDEFRKTFSELFHWNVWLNLNRWISSGKRTIQNSRETKQNIYEFKNKNYDYINLIYNKYDVEWRSQSLNELTPY